MQHAPLSAITGVQNKYQYNGIEFADDLGLNWYDALYRDLDPTIGRWMTLDPKYDSTISMSPYVAMNNNPIKIIDPKGDVGFLVPGFYINTCLFLDTTMVF